MKNASENASKALTERVNVSQRLGSERVEQAKQRKAGLVYGDDDIQKAIELSLQEMKQEKARAKREEIKQNKIAKAKEAYTSTLMSCVIETDLTSGELGQKAK